MIQGHATVETLLRDCVFSAADCERAAALVQALRDNRVSKYNVGVPTALNWRQLAAGRRLLLVPGQVLSQTVLITGSNRGIGLEFTRQYASLGWNVIATCRSPQKADELQAIAANHNQVIIERLDLLDHEGKVVLCQNGWSNTEIFTIFFAFLLGKTSVKYRRYPEITEMLECGIL